MCKFRSCPKAHFLSFFLPWLYHILSVQWQLPNSISNPLFLWAPTWISHKFFKLIMSKTELILFPQFPSSPVLPISMNGDAIHKHAEIRQSERWWYYFNGNSSSITKTYTTFSLCHKSTIFIHFHCHSPSPGLMQQPPTWPLHIQYWLFPKVLFYFSNDLFKYKFNHMYSNI